MYKVRISGDWYLLPLVFESHLLEIQIPKDQEDERTHLIGIIKEALKSRNPHIEVSDNQRKMLLKTPQIPELVMYDFLDDLKFINGFK